MNQISITRRCREEEPMASKQGRGDDTLARIAGQVEKVAGQVRWLAYQLRQSGIAEEGLGFAIRTLGSERVKREVEQGPPFGVRCRGRAAFATDPEEAAAWTILSACEPGAVTRRLGTSSASRRRGPAFNRHGRAGADRGRDRSRQPRAQAKR